jgi:formylglycine-generating enzyme required for sulfatase activity
MRLRCIPGRSRACARAGPAWSRSRRDLPPAFRGEKDAKEVPVAAFQLDVRPVTNGEFLAFVRESPKWQRSQVKRLFADERYLAHWAGDLELGSARAEQPVTNVSWFAAKAFASARGKRLPTTAEWEVAAAVGFTVRDGAKDVEFQADLARWYARHRPVLPDAEPDGRIYSVCAICTESCGNGRTISTARS